MDANQTPTSPCGQQAKVGRWIGKARSERRAFQPYRGKPAVRNDRGDRGDVGIIRSPVRASVLPDRSTSAPTDDARSREVRLCHSSWEADEQSGPDRSGAGRATGGGKGEREPAKHGQSPEHGGRGTV